MATNKHAIIRYQALDKCFSNSGRKFYIEDLVNACNEALYEYDGIEDGVKKRQVQADITFMESEQGWSIPLERIPDGKRVFYRYEDSHYSINSQTLNQSEVEHLKETVYMLNRFKGMPHFDWMEEVLTRLESSFHLKGEQASQVVGFEQNPYLKGLEHFSVLFDAIINKQVLNIVYQRFGKDEDHFIIHPYFLKQYNNRWFLFGLNKGYEGRITNMPLDRIISIESIHVDYIEYGGVEWDEYFDDVVGVTVFENKPTEKVILRIDNNAYHYIHTKPLHGSQILKTKTEHYSDIELTIQLNYEFETLLLGFADRIEILEPKALKEAIKKRVNNIIIKNN